MPIRSLLGSTTPASQLPAYARGHTGNWDPARSIYNHSGSNLKTWREWLGQMRAGIALCRLGVIGDSMSAGYGTNVGTEDPYSQLKVLFTKAGFACGELVWPGTALPTLDNRWVNGSPGWSIGGNGYMTATANTSTVTYTSQATGTVVEILCTGQSATFTYTIDGGSVQTVTTTGASAMRLVTVTGLANTTHTVVLTGPSSGTAKVAAVGVRGSSGLVIMNASLSGASTTTYLGTGAYSDPLGMVLGAAPNAVIVGLGANDYYNAGLSVAQYKANMVSICTSLKTAGSTVFLDQIERNGTDQPEAWPAAQYAISDQFAAPLLDLYDLMQTPISALYAAGASPHLNAAGYQIKAEALANLLILPKPNV